jgi:hypothetical protein
MGPTSYAWLIDWLDSESQLVSKGPRQRAVDTRATHLTFWRMSGRDWGTFDDNWNKGEVQVGFSAGRSGRSASPISTSTTSVTPSARPWKTRGGHRTIDYLMGHNIHGIGEHYRHGEPGRGKQLPVVGTRREQQRPEVLPAQSRVWYKP